MTTQLRHERELLNSLCRLSAAERLAEAPPADTCLDSGNGALASIISSPLRPLTRQDIEQLEAAGNRSSDWSLVLISEATDLALVRDSRFEGRVVLGALAPAARRLASGLTVNGGIDRARLRDVVVGDGACLADATLQGVVMGRNVAAVEGTRVLGGPEPQIFGLARDMVVAPGSGGRQFPMLPGMRFRDVADLARQAGNAHLMAQWRAHVEAQRASLARSFSYIGSGSALVGARHVRNVLAGPGTQIVGAAVVEDSVLNGTSDRPVQVLHDVIVRRCIIEADGVISDGARCEASHFCEATWAREGCFVRSSVIGPNSGVSSGECESSLLGPFVSFHHSSLLIATFWPEGRGNLSYGANVGSNHTGKAPDQEHWAGEGVFYGLDVAVKFPANYTDAPYTLIASGVTTLPQCVRFPFSLINHAIHTAPALSPAFNELVPGWVFARNLYSLLRSEQKFAQRNRAHEPLETRALRPDQLPLLCDAISRLRSVAPGPGIPVFDDGEPFYLEEHVEGVGKNYLRESIRIQAIQAYEEAMVLIAALEVLHQLAGDDAPPHNLDRPWGGGGLAAQSDAVWHHLPPWSAPGATWRSALAGASGMLERAIELARLARESDDARGRRIIPDYALIHPPASDDPLVRSLTAKLTQVQRCLNMA